MFSLTTQELDNAFAAIQHHGYSAMLPAPLLLCLPAAWVVHRLSPNLLANTLLAVIAFAITSLVAVGLPLFSYDPLIVIYYILLLASLPVAVWLLAKLGRNAPNNSFKPTPLRGAA